MEQPSPVGLRRLNKPLKQELTYKSSTSMPILVGKLLLLSWRDRLLRRSQQILFSIISELGKIWNVLNAEFRTKLQLLHLEGQFKVISMSTLLCLQMIALRTAVVLMSSNGGMFLNQKLLPPHHQKLSLLGWCVRMLSLTYISTLWLANTSIVYTTTET